MFEWIDVFNFSVISSSFMLMILGLVITIISRAMSPRSKRFFIFFFSIFLVYVGSIFAEQFAQNSTVTQVLIFIESLSSSVLMPLLTILILYFSGKKPLGSIWLYIASFFFVTYLVLLIITQFTTGIYYITPDNAYHRGPYYPVLLIPPVLTMLTNLLAVLVHRKNLTVKQFVSFLFYILFPTVCMLLQMKFYGFYLIMVGTTFSALVMFIIIQTEMTDNYLRQMQENSRQQSRILVLQMRPHFIYNTMTSIYYLCRENPEKAQQVILDFTTYLRKNFTALEKEEVVLFEEELEHTRAYLAVESVRFEEQISFVFDTPETGFRLPALTLQPIVENAVKHGVDTEGNPLHIKISTRKTDAYYEVLVEDDGPGFSENESHNPNVALNNIKKRLSMTCHGLLEIESEKNRGTLVKILIPAQVLRKT